MTTNTEKSPDDKPVQDKVAPTFKCKFCQQAKPLNQMVTVSRFFPPLVACRQCEKEIR